jgi:UDP-glucuronate 4-epimerase
MTYLVTGAAGFIAARVVHLLLSAGHRVIGIDNLNNYYSPALKQYRINSIQQCHLPFTFLEADITDIHVLRSLFAQQRITAILHLAAMAGVRYSIMHPSLYVDTNVHGSLNLLQCASDFHVPTFILASTSSLYADCPLPFTEDANITSPRSPYAATKLASETLARTWHYLHGLNVAILRYFTVYGPAGRPDMSPFRIAESIRTETPFTLYGDGQQTRDFTYVDDIARGTILALNTKGVEVFNLGGGGFPLSINFIISELESIFGRQAQLQRRPPHQADMDHTSACTAKAKQILGWEPQTPPEQGLHMMARWHLEHASLLDDIFGGKPY